MSFPVKTTNERIEDILRLEGRSRINSGIWRGVTSNTYQPSIITTTIPNAGPAFVFLNSTLSLRSTESVRLAISANSDTSGFYEGVLNDVLIPKNTNINIDLKGVVNSLGMGLNLYPTDPEVTPIDTKTEIGYTFSATQIINDLNFSAPNKVFWVGDSITAFTANNIGVQNYYQFQVRDWLSRNSNKGVYRLCQKAAGGKQSRNVNDLLISGLLYVEEPSIVFYQMGVNDHSQSIPVSEYKSNLERFLLYKNTFWKNSILCFLGATPVQDNTRQNGLDVYRNIMLEVVNESGQNNVKFINLRDSFDRTATPSTIWAASDNPGSNTDCLHPGTLISHTGIANTIISGIQDWGTRII